VGDEVSSHDCSATNGCEMTFTIGNPREGGTYTSDETDIVRLKLWSNEQLSYGIGGHVMFDLEVHLRNGATKRLSKDAYGTIDRLYIYERAVAMAVAARMSFGEKWRDVIKYVVVEQDDSA
jgi:hypothetical protein